MAGLGSRTAASEESIRHNHAVQRKYLFAHEHGEARRSPLGLHLYLRKMSNTINRTPRSIAWFPIFSTRARASTATQSSTTSTPPALAQAPFGSGVRGAAAAFGHDSGRDHADTQGKQRGHQQQLVEISQQGYEVGNRVDRAQHIGDDQPEIEPRVPGRVGVDKRQGEGVHLALERGGALLEAREEPCGSVAHAGDSTGKAGGTRNRRAGRQRWSLGSKGRRRSLRAARRASGWPARAPWRQKASVSRSRRGIPRASPPPQPLSRPTPGREPASRRSPPISAAPATWSARRRRQSRVSARSTSW